MSTYEDRLAELRKKYGLDGATTTPTASTSQQSKGATSGGRAAEIRKKYGIQAPGAPTAIAPAETTLGGTHEYPTADYEQTMRDAIPLGAASTPIPSAQVNFAPMDEHQISGFTPDAIPSRVARTGRPAILTDGLNTAPQPPVKEYDFATAGAEVGPVQTWQDVEREKAIRKYMPSQTPEGQAATQSAAEKAAQDRAQRLADIKANPDWLYAAIQEGRVLPQDMQDVSANSIPWQRLAQNPESPWAKIGAKGLTDPEGARADLLTKMQGRETTGYDVARAIKTAGTDVLLFGAQPVDVAPQTKAGRAAYTGTEIAGGLAQIAAAGATGGAAAESVATRLLPQAARATEAGNLLLRGARGVGTGLALQGAKEAAHVVGTGEVQPGAAGRIGREAAFFGILDTLMPSLGGVTTQGVHRALPEAIRDTVAGRAISAGAGGAVAGGTTSLLVNSLFQPENEQEASVWNRVLTDAVQIGLFGAIHGAMGSTETGFKTQPPQEIIGQQIGGRIYRGIPEAELAAAQKAKGDLSQLGYTEFKPNSGVWQKRAPDGTLIGEVHEDVMVGDRQVPKIVADRAARFNRSAPEPTPAEPQAPGALSAPPPVITPEQAQTQARHILASAGGDRSVALGMLEEYQRNTSDPTVASMVGAIAEVIRGSAPVASPPAPLPVPTPNPAAKGPKPKAQPQTPVTQPVAQPTTQPVTQAVSDARVAQLKAAMPDVNEAAITRIVENSQDLNDQGFVELFTRITGQQSPESAPAAPVVASTPTTPASIPAAPPERDGGSTGLQNLGGRGVVEGMYDMLWEKAQKGDTTEAGAPSAVLQAAKVVRDSGGLQTREELKSFANEVQAVRDSGVTGKAYQDGIGAVVAKYTPQATAPPAPVTAPATDQLPAPAGEPARVPEQPRPSQTTPPAEATVQPPAPTAAAPASDLEQARKRVTDAGSAINAVLDPAMQQVFGAAPESGGERAVAIGKFTTHVMNGGEVSSRALQQAIKVPQNVANALNNAYHSSQALRDVITERRDAIAALRPLEAANRQAQEVPAPTAKPTASPKPTATKAHVQTPLPPEGLSVRTSANYKGEAQRKGAADYDKAIDEWAVQNNHDRQGFQLVRTLFSDGQWRPAIRTTQAGANPAPGWVQLTSERGESAGAFYAVDHTHQAPAQETAPAVPVAPVTSADARPAATPMAKTIATGDTATAKTERGTEVQTQYALVDAGNLVASHDTALKANPEYPQELQPRDRSRMASEDQINRMVGGLEPSFLGASPKASEGAPIVGPDMVVESGNGRTIALQRAYEQGHKSAETYKQWLVDNAQSFGLDPQAVTDAAAPVLVRVRQTEVDRVDFASQANEQSVAAMSATEQAVSDAKKLTGDVMHWFNPTDSGEIVHPGNRDFVRAFLQKVVGPTEQGRYLTADGTLSQEGIARIRNAVFAKAYGDSSAIEKLAESPDNNVRAITTGMLTAAGRIAQVKDGITKGQYFDVDLSQDITSAMAKLSQLRDSGQSVADFLRPKQLAFFQDDLSDLSKDILDVFEQHKRSPKKIGALLMAYADAVEAAGDPRQQTLWSKANPTRAELWQAAVQTMEANAGGGVQASLFQDPGASGQGVAAANETGGTPAQAEQGQSQGFTLKDALAEERGGISMPGRKPAPVDPLTQEIDQSISWNGQKQPRAAGAPIKETVRKVGNAIVDEMFDSNAPIRRMQKALAGNKEVSTDMDAYLRLNLLPKAVPGYTEAKLHDLEHVLRPLGEKLKDYLRYADAKSTLWRAKQFGYTFDEGKLPMKESVAQAFVDRVEQGPDAKLLKDAYQGEQKLYDGMLDELKDAGMLNDEAIGKMRDAYGEKDSQGKITGMNYVPMFRDMKAETNVKGDAVGTKPGAGGATGQGRSSVNVPKATQAQHGSARKLMDPMERRIRYIARVIGVAERNKAGMALAKFAQSFDTNGDFMVKVAPPMEHVEAKIDNLMHQLEDMGFDPSDLVDPNATIEFFKPKWARGKNDTVVTIYQEGKATYWDMHDPAVLKAIATMEPSVTGPIAKVLDMAARGVTTAYRTGATISPSFTVANLLRDTAESYILSKHQMVPGQALFEALRLVAQKDPFVQRTIDAGLKQGGFLRPETLSTNMARQIADPRGSFLHVRTLWKLYQETREQPEFWTRLGEASLEYKARLKAGTPEEAAFLRAMYEGGRITLNFTRGGTTARAINRYVPFFKIPFEAGLRTYEAATENKRPIYDPRSFWFKAIIPATAMALTTVLLNQDNEAYKEASDSERDKYVLIPVGKALIRIPKPNGAFGVYFNLVERSLRLQMMQDPKAFRDFGKGAVAEVSPRVSNPALELLVGFATKYSMSDDRDILTQPEQKLSATQQYDSKTSPTIKAGAQTLGLSPKMTQWAIDKVIPGYSAGYFMTEDWIRKAGDNSQPAIKPEDYPVVGRFISRPGEGKQGRSVSLFYDRVQQTDQVYNDLRDKILKESRQPVQMDKLSGEQLRIRNRLLTEMSPEDKVLYAQRKPLTKWDDQLAGLRKKRDAIDANRSMNPDAKKGALEQINRQLTDTAQRALQATKSK